MPRSFVKKHSGVVLCNEAELSLRKNLVAYKSRISVKENFKKNFVDVL